MEDLDTKIEKGHWHWAKTYAETAPHWYIRHREEPKLYQVLREKIKAEGKVEKYTNYDGISYLVTYFYYGNYKYWEMFPVINRAEVN